MEVLDFIWLDSVIDKLASKHGIRQQEVVEVFDGSPTFRFLEKGNRQNEDLYAAYSQTDAGRYLTVFFI